MATFDGNDLKTLRLSKGMSVPDLACAVGEDESMIRRYEGNINKNPNPETMYLLCQAVGDDRDWQNWMRTEFPKSYGRVHPEPVPYGLEGCILSLKSELRDLKKLMGETIEDGADGRIDSYFLREKLMKELVELIAAAQALKTLLEGGEKEWMNGWKNCCS